MHYGKLRTLKEEFQGKKQRPLRSAEVHKRHYLCCVNMAVMQGQVRLALMAHSSQDAWGADVKGTLQVANAFIWVTS